MKARAAHGACMKSVFYSGMDGLESVVPTQYAKV